MAAQSAFPDEQLGMPEKESIITTDAYGIPEGAQTASPCEDHDIGQFGYKPELEVFSSVTSKGTEHVLTRSSGDSDYGV
jgi:hypothetical protein